MAPGRGNPWSVSIGGTLAEARHAAGLSIADVSARTRIRTPLIRAIENDDFGPCGGDFYARGHIRAIARVVGVDSLPLIADYDTAHPEGKPAALDDLLEPHPAREEPPPRGRQRQARGPEHGPEHGRPPGRGRRLARLPAPLVLIAAVALAVIGGGAYQLTAGSGPRQTAGGAPRSPAPASASPAHATTPRTTAPTGAAPSPSAPAVTPLTPSGVAALGPGGTGDGDNPGSAGQALSGDPGAPWRTDWYTTAAFGNTKQGTGLLFTLPRAVTAAAVTIRLGVPGASLQIRAGTSRGSLHTIASLSSAGRTVRLTLASQPRLRYLVLWFTRLPPDGQGTYQAAVYGVTVGAVGNS
jgi:cytoskeleton protein RodZ